MGKKIPNLETAKELCRELGFTFEFEMQSNQHIKFYIHGCPKYLHISSKSDNYDKVRKELRSLLTANGCL